MRNFNVIIVAMFFFNIVSAQMLTQELIIDTANKFNSDVNVLSEGYTQPLVNAVVNGQNASLTTTTTFLKPFEITFGAVVTTISIPSSDEVFTPSQLNFFEIDSNSAPTILGSDLEPEIRTKEILRDLGIEASFTLPPGIKSDLPNEVFALPSFTFSMGLLAETEIQLNYFPEYSAEGVAYSSRGIGIKHGIDRYLNINQESKWNAAISLNYISSDMQYERETSDINADFDISSFIGNALVSYDTKALSLFGGLGYFSSNYAFSMNNIVTISGEYADVFNPLIEDYSIDEKKVGSFAFVGLNLKILFFDLITKYNIQEYNSLLLGVNLNF